jgi:hypothetical protein
MTSYEELPTATSDGHSFEDNGASKWNYFLGSGCRPPPRLFFHVKDNPVMPRGTSSTSRLRRTGSDEFSSGAL